MATNFTTIKTNVGTRVGDTTSAFATTIGVYVNQRYEDILKRLNVETIDEDYSINTVAGTQDYALESGFGKELYVYDSTNKVEIYPTTIQTLERDHYADLDSTGTVQNYAIYFYMTTDSPAARARKIRFFYTPSQVLVIKIPYVKGFVALSGATDNFIIACERAVELGATADAWATKRQGAKAQYFETLYRDAISTLAWEKENQPNQITQFRPDTNMYDRNIIG